MTISLHEILKVLRDFFFLSIISDPRDTVSHFNTKYSHSLNMNCVHTRRRMRNVSMGCRVQYLFVSLESWESQGKKRGQETCGTILYSVLHPCKLKVFREGSFTQRSVSLSVSQHILREDLPNLKDCSFTLKTLTCIF